MTTTRCRWVTFELPHYDDGRPVTRRDAMTQAAAQLGDLMAGDPGLAGGTLVLDDGERIALPTRRGARS